MVRPGMTAHDGAGHDVAGPDRARSINPAAWHRRVRRGEAGLGKARSINLVPGHGGARRAFAGRGPARHGEARRGEARNYEKLARTCPRTGWPQMPTIEDLWH